MIILMVSSAFFSGEDDHHGVAGVLRFERQVFPLDVAAGPEIFFRSRLYSLTVSFALQERGMY
jgi:hypothetical protein